MALTNKQRAFCEEYVIDRDGQKAARRAGYKSTTYMASMVDTLLKNPAVVAKIAELDEEIRQRNQITKDTIIKDICEIRDRCMQRVPVMVFDYQTKEFVQKIDENGEGVWQFDANNALKACDMLAKHVGFYEKDKAPLVNANILVAPNIGDLKRIKRMLDESQ